ncbi:MAG: [citrate (pro-3S)-lyase] ligase [Candidatus Limivicinus sp.]|jgi:[citrate (pro-3S)-lyase] ligase
MEGIIRRIGADDKEAFREMEELLIAEGIELDGNLDYSCGLYDENCRMIGTGSCFRNTIRCLAVDSGHRGEGLLNVIISHLIEVQTERGNFHLFLYTKPETADFMSQLGFYEIARVENKLIFMENRRSGFKNFCSALKKNRIQAERTAAVVMNANPFTLGHRHLIEKAAAGNDAVHLFILSENAGPIPPELRYRFAENGVKDIPNVICHGTGPYIISSATFPSYFLKDRDTVIRVQAELDLKVFGRIASALNIQRRYAGEERSSRVTGLYNQVMAEKLPENGVEFVEIPRLETGGRIISASTVRKAIHDGCIESVKDFLPPEEYDYFTGPEGAAVCAAIRNEKDSIHY